MYHWQKWFWEELRDDEVWGKGEGYLTDYYRRRYERKMEYLKSPWYKKLWIYLFVGLNEPLDKL